MEHHKFRSFAIPSLLLFILGWGGLFVVIYLALPFVWLRWSFFVLLIFALTGTVLPIVYFFHRRFPGEPPAESNVIIRQSVWFGVYGATLFTDLQRSSADLKLAFDATILGWSHAITLSYHVPPTVAELGYP